MNMHWTAHSNTFQGAYIIPYALYAFKMHISSLFLPNITAEFDVSSGAELAGFIAQAPV